jgi:tetratricopeptide (TPR) repeat protein
MSAFASPHVLNSKQLAVLNQLKDDAVALEGDRQFDEAYDKYEEGLAIQLSSIGNLHVDTMETMNSIERAIEAIKLRDEASTNADTFATSDDLYKAGRHDDAMVLDQSLLERQKKSLGSEHRLTLRTMSNIGVTLGQQRKHLESLAMLERVLEKQVRVLGSDDLETLQTINSIGYQMTQLKRYDESIVLLKKVLQRRSRLLGDDHLDTISTLSFLARAYSGLKRFDEAVETSQVVFDKRLRLLGEEHPHEFCWSLILQLSIHPALVNGDNRTFHYPLSSNTRLPFFDVLLSRPELARIRTLLSRSVHRYIFQAQHLIYRM